MNATTNQEPPIESTLWTKSFPVGPLQCNCTIIGDLQTGKALVFDPGGSEEKILSLLAEKNLTPTQIYHTHAHFDHFLASG
ncbi:MAG: MBL fold metallo-hydrolase, partial [Cyanobacteria bacterium]|nr:MBL fold metallo-hydrolase [Cyanobacteriota bacterium]